MILLNLSEIFRKRETRSADTDPLRTAQRAELRELLLLRDSIQSKFDLETDEDRIEVFIYEMEALDARIRSVLRRARRCTGEKETEQEKIPTAATA